MAGENFVGSKEKTHRREGTQKVTPSHYMRGLAQRVNTKNNLVEGLVVPDAICPSKVGQELPSPRAE